jgi:hypothetical protein
MRNKNLDQVANLKSIPVIMGAARLDGPSARRAIPSHTAAALAKLLTGRSVTRRSVRS